MKILTGGVKTMKGLTEKQRQVLEFIESFEETNGMAPTVYEIAENFSVKTFAFKVILKNVFRLVFSIYLK